MALPAIDRREQRRILAFCKVMPAWLAALVIVSGALTLVAWALGYGDLTGSSGPVMMPPVTAATFIIAGLSLLIAQRRDSRVAVFLSRMLAAIVAGLALLVLFEYGTGRHYGLDMLWFADLDPPRLANRRMAMNSALGFVLFSQGLIFLERDRRTRGLRSQGFATLALIIGFIALVGHVFDVRDFYSLTLLAGMSLTAAVTFVILGFGLLFSQIDRGVPALIVDDGAAGFVARRLLPGALVVPFSLTLIGILLQERGVFGDRLGGSLVAVADMVVFLLLIAWSARVVREVDSKRGELFVLEREARAASERARKEAEEAMAEAEAARSEAESANRAKSDFLAVMSHELRTPLAAIMGYQELLADGITGPVTDAQVHQLGRIRASARHLLSLIDEILTFTRLDAGREVVQRDTVNLDDAMRDAISIVEPLTEGKKIELVVNSPGDGAAIETDSTKLRQIMVNLLTNAVKFTEEGHVTFDGKIEGDEVALTVTDSGIGIGPEHINRIFDPFWQVEQKATRRAAGTGLGLTVTRRLANLLGGDVSVSSLPGKGSAFSVRLPVRLPANGRMPERALKAG